MANTFTISGRSSILSVDYYPPIELEPNTRYGLGLVGFYSYNSILNIDGGNNNFTYKKAGAKSFNVVQIPPGTYEIDEIYHVLLKLMNLKSRDEEQDKRKFTLRANNNTLRCEIISEFIIDFTPKDSIGSLLGFEKIVLRPNILYESTLPVDIIKVRIIRIDTNITGGAYLNSKQSHTIFEFDLDVEPGYKLTKEPQNIIYMPVKPDNRQYIENITLRILDNNNELIDFRGEEIIIKLELKKLF